MVDPTKLIFNLSWGELISGLQDEFPMLAAAATKHSENSEVAAGPTFRGRVCFSLPEAEQAFGVSHKTMCQWKKTWMAPAWQQEGRKCRLDYDYAILLMERRKKLDK